MQPGRLDILRVDVATTSRAVVVAGLSEVLALIVDANDDLFYSEGSTGSIHRVPAGTGTSQLIFRYSSTAAPLTLPHSDRVWTLAFDGQGHLLGGGFLLIRISPGADGRVDGSADEAVAWIGGIRGDDVPTFSEPFSGDGLPAARALLMLTYQMIVAADGAVVFADYSGRIRRIVRRGWSRQWRRRRDRAHDRGLLPSAVVDGEPVRISPLPSTGCSVACSKILSRRGPSSFRPSSRTSYSVSGHREAAIRSPSADVSVEASATPNP